MSFKWFRNSEIFEYSLRHRLFHLFSLLHKIPRQIVTTNNSNEINRSKGEHDNFEMKIYLKTTNYKAGCLK